MSENSFSVEGVALIVRSALGPGWRVEDSQSGKVCVSATFFVDVPRFKLFSQRDALMVADDVRAQVEDARDRLVKPSTDPSAVALALCEAASRVVDMWQELGMTVPPKLAGAVAQWRASK